MGQAGRLGAGPGHLARRDRHRALKGRITSSRWRVRCRKPWAVRPIRRRALQPGADADIVVFDRTPVGSRGPKNFRRIQVHVYEGEELFGWPDQVYLRQAAGSRTRTTGCRPSARRYVPAMTATARRQSVATWAPCRRHVRRCQPWLATGKLVCRNTRSAECLLASALENWDVGH